jgi:ubiquinone/menaquinone biosynthesis C-methylase UbiE
LCYLIEMTIQKSANDTDKFNRWSHSYERHIGQFFLFDPVHREVLNQIARMKGEQGPASLLDVGCGTGRLLRKVQARWPDTQLIGVDLAKGMIEVARRLAPGVEFRVGGAETLTFPDAAIDVALSTISFHHWNDPASGISNISRMLRPGGIFCLADIVLPVSYARFYQEVNPRGLSIFLQHYRKISPDAVRDLFTQSGLRVKLQRRMRVGFVLLTVGVKE